MKKYNLLVLVTVNGNDSWKVWARGPKEKLEREATKRGWLEPFIRIEPIANS